MHTEESSTTIRSRLDDAMALLDARARQVMELWLEGASHAEVANALGLSEQAVTAIRGSALWRLRDLIARQSPPSDTDLGKNTRIAAEGPRLSLGECSMPCKGAREGCPR